MVFQNGVKSIQALNNQATNLTNTFNDNAYLVVITHKALITYRKDVNRQIITF